MEKLKTRQLRKRHLSVSQTIIPLLCIILAGTMITAVSIGPITIPFKETVLILLNKLSIPVNSSYSDQQWIVITEVRLPRVLVGSLVGASLSISGVAMQGLFRNPLVEPGFIGVSSGAAFGAVCAIFFGWTAFNKWMLPFAAFLGALIAMATIIAVWRVSKARSVAILLLLGIGINAFFSALTNLLIASSETEQALRSSIAWLQGGLEARTWEHLLIISPPIIIGSLIMCAFGRSLNVMLLGDDHAKSSGINIKIMRNSILTLAALITGAAVAVSGIISFIGLVVPHMLRLVMGPDHRLLLPASMLGGAVFLVLTDLVSRIILQPITLQVGVISAMIGAPIFIILILRSNRGLGI